MINKYKKFINEKLSDKLSGFDSIGLLHQYEKGEIDLQRYLMICYKNDIKIPNEFENILKEKFLNGTVKLKTYINACIMYKLTQPTREEIYEYLNKYLDDDIDLYFLYACEFNFQDIIDRINLDDVSDMYCDIALPNVIKNGNFELFKKLIERNKDLNNEFDNPLYNAVKYKQNDMIKYLLKIGVIVNDDVFELDMSSEIKELLEKCYETSIKKRNEILIEKLSDKLSGFNEKEIKQQFLNGKIILNNYINLCKDNNINMPTRDELIIALDKLFENEKTVNLAYYFKYFKDNNIELLSEKQIKKYISTGKVLINVYLYICEEFGYEYPNKNEIHEIISNYKDFDKMLLDACRYDYVDLVKKAINNGSEYHKKIVEPIVVACKKGNLEIVKYLVEHDLPKSNIDYSLEYVINNYSSEYAINNKYLEIVKYLLEKGATVSYSFTKNLYFGEMRDLILKYYKKQNDNRL